MSGFKLMTPAGEPVRGVVQIVRGCALADSIDANGEPVWEGETDLWWDEQTDDTEAGPDGKPERVWVCFEGMAWRESELVRVALD